MEVEPDEARAIASEVLWMTRLRLSPVPGGCGKEIPAIESIRVIGEGLVERYIPESGIKCGQIYNTQMAKSRASTSARSVGRGCSKMVCPS